ncbi:MAG: asparaginase, partial [Oscillospiraceae bacterium]|nr:asparaginase [Oscillospiraceae bacterium]
VDEMVLPKSCGEPQLKTAVSDEVFLLKLTPGLSPRIFDALADMGYKGIVVEAFGLGGVNVLNESLSAINRVLEKGINVVVTSQCLYDSSNLGVYQVGTRLLALGVVQARDMTSEAAMTKLMWGIGQGYDNDRIKQLFATNLAGEISL